MAKEQIGLEEAVRRILVECGDIPVPELVGLVEQRYGLKLDARFLPIIRASLRHRAESEARRAAAKDAEVKPLPKEGDSDAQSTG